MVKETGIVRKVDELGRVALPAETRRVLGIQERDPLAVLVDEACGRIILQRVAGVCLKCGAADGLKEIKEGFYLCGDWVASL